MTNRTEPDALRGRKSQARAVADLGEGTIVATVEIGAPPERVFRALTSNEIVQWWGAEGLYRTTEWTGDVRVGGRFRSAGVGADGKRFAVEGAYLEIDPPRRLVHTWEPDWAPGAVTTVKYRLQSIAGGTRVTLRHEGFASPEACADHGDGWPRVLDWLKGYAAPRAPRSYFLIRLVPPRASFMVDMKADERQIMGEHVAYWTKQLGEGTAVAFGPVADPQGGWGVGIVEVDDPEQVKALEANDPAIRSGRGFRYEVLVMPQAIVRR